ncbi:MAG: YkvA family protein [bacterium]
MANPFRFTRFLESAQLSPGAVIAFIIHIPNFIRLLSRLLNDPRVPYHLKLFCYFAMIYFIFPLDLWRDFRLFGLGYADDVLLLFFAFRKLVRDSPPEVVREHVEAISQGRPAPEYRKD